METLPGIVPLYTAAEMRTVDRLAVDEIGIPGAVLMERAGMGAAAEILEWFGDARRVVVLCGSGNNGGDGFVVARHLHATGRHVQILLVEPESKIRRESKVNLEIARKLGIHIERVKATGWKKALADAELVVDAMLGTGVTGAPRPNVDVAIAAVEASLLPVVALDIPTGVDASTGTVEGTAIQADLTVTFHAPKVGLAIAPGRFRAGRVKALDIGIPGAVDEAARHGIATPALLQFVPPQQRDWNKYSAGAVLCIGGAVGMSGAISLATQAAMRAGAGVVWGAVPEPLAMHLDTTIPEVQFRGAIADAEGRFTVAAAERLEELVDRADTVVFGCGIGMSDQIRALARWVVREAKSLVLDAQGIMAFAGECNALAVRDGAPTLITPHEGELAALLGSESSWVRANRLEAVRAAAQQTRAAVLLKGEDSIVCLPSGDFVVARGHASQATAGTGDVLAGVCGALLARGMEPLLAGTCAALACGVAAEASSSVLSASGVIASDLLTQLPGALAGRVLEGVS